MTDTIIFEAGNFGAKKVYAYDGISVRSLFDITGTLRTAEDVAGGFYYVESSATEQRYDLRFYDATSGTAATVFNGDGSFGPPAAMFLQAYQGGVLFKDYEINDGGPIKLYRDGTISTLIEDNTSPFNDRFNGAGDYEAWLGLAGDRIFTSGGARGNELAISDGTAVGTSFEDFIPDSTSENGSPRDFVTGDGGVYFIANFPNGGGSGFLGNASGIVFGSASGGLNILSRANDLGSTPSIADIEFAGNTLFVSGRRPLTPDAPSPSDTGLFRLDSNAPFSLELVASSVNGQQLNPDQLVDFQDKLLFTSNGNLFVSDGTTSGTQQLTFGLSDVTTVSSGVTKAFFWGTSADAGKELWVTDGTAGGTSQVIDLKPGASGQQGLAITVLNDIAHFEGRTDSVAGLYASNGTEAGTSLVLAGGRTPIAVSLGELTAPRVLINSDKGPQPGLINSSNITEVRSTPPGTSGNDTVGSLGRSERLDLGDGLDRFIISERSDSYTKDVSATAAELSNGSETYLLENVERVTFVDGTLQLDTGAGETAGEAYRIYQAAFARTPDNDGLSFWLELMDGGMSLAEVAGFFLISEEFQTAYGTNLSNAAYVDQLYQNVLQRDGEPSGVAFWLDILDRNALSRAEVLSFFAESAENIQGLAPVIEDGYFLI